MKIKLFIVQSCKLNFVDVYHLLLVLRCSKIHLKNRYVKSMLQKFIPGVSFQSFVFFVYCFISILLKIFFWVYSDGDYVSVINASNSSSPTCCLISLFCTLNLFQKSSDKSSLLNIFDTVIITNKTFLLSFSFTG